MRKATPCFNDTRYENNASIPCNDYSFYSFYKHLQYFNAMLYILGRLYDAPTAK